jgi:hypothetical protein
MPGAFSVDWRSGSAPAPQPHGLPSWSEGQDKSGATVIATSTNFLGLGVGALMSGVLAEYASSPLRLPFILYLLILAVISALVWFTRETVVRREMVKGPTEPAAALPMRKRRAALRAAFCLNIRKC